ncbi:Putative ribonuclease H protein At1g65750 [Linum perenne]
MLHFARNLLGFLRITRNPVQIRSHNFHNDPIHVVWKKPETRWIKLNFDGSCKGENGVSSIGGVIRNHKSEFMLAYAEPICSKTSTLAEMAALQRGLELVRENGWNKVWLEGDAKSIMDIIHKSNKKVSCMELQKFAKNIGMIMSYIDECKLSHVYREGNRTADKLARMGHHLKKLKVWRHVPPNDDVLQKILREDAIGKTINRRR